MTGSPATADIQLVPLACASCGARIDPGSVGGAFRCSHCGTALYLDAGTGLPHRIVTSVLGTRALERIAEDRTRREGGRGRPEQVTLYYIPYFIVGGGERAGAWEGRAAISLPASAPRVIRAHGSRTALFDPSLVPSSALLLDPSLTSAQACGGERAVELRHVPVALVQVGEDPSAARALWIDAERGRVLNEAEPRTAASPRAPVGRLGLAVAAAGAALGALALPAPWSLLPVPAIAYAVARWSRSAPGSAPRR